MIIKITYPLVLSRTEVLVLRRAEVSTVMPLPPAILRAGSVEASPLLLKWKFILTQLLSMVNKSRYHYKVCVCLCCLVLLSGTLWGQERSSISNTADTNRITQLLQAGQKYYHAQTDTALLIFNQALQLSQGIQYPDGIAESLTGMANCYLEKGQFEKAKMLFKQSLPYCQKAIHKPEQKISLWHMRMAIPYMYENGADSALYYLQKAGQLAKAQKDYTTLIKVNANIGAMYNSKSQSKRAINYLREAEHMAVSQNITSDLPLIYSNLTVAYYNNNDTLNNTVYYGLKALDYSRQFNNLRIQRLVLSALGSYYVRIKQYSRAKQYYRQSLDLSDTTNRFSTFGIHYGLAAAHYQLQEWDKAAQYADTALNLIHSTDSKNTSLASLYLLRAKIDKVLGNNNGAYHFMEQYANLNDSLNKLERNRALDQLEVSYQSARKDKNLMLKNLQIARQQASLRKRNAWITGITVGAVALASTSLLLLSLYRNQKQKEKLQSEQWHNLQKDVEINELKAAIQGQENERTRIARELHDGIASQLMTVRLSVFSLLERNSMVPGEDILPIYQQVKDAADELITVAHNLIPDALKEHGLATAVKLLCDKVRQQAQIDIQLEIATEIPRFAAEQELSCYRIIQELIQNVLKHAKATTCLVQLSIWKDVLYITVEDNGIGIHITDQQLTGLGMKNIRERVTALSGTITIDTGEKSGTSVYIECPVMGDK